MFSLFKKSDNKNLKTVTLKLSGLHCTSCAVNTDLSLEELPGVTSDTNYAKSETIVSFDPQKTSLSKIESTINALGYSVIKDI